MGNEKPKVEFIKQDGLIEIRYFDTPKDERYLSWKIPMTVANELITWQKKIKQNKNRNFPLKETTKNCEFTMATENHINIREFSLLTIDFMKHTDLVFFIILLEY